MARLWDHAETGAVRLHSRDDFIKHMTGKFPFMNDEALGRTWPLAIYYTVHEGY